MGRKKKVETDADAISKPDDVAVKYDRILAEKLKQIVQRRGGTMSKYLSDLTRDHVEREYAKVIREMADELDSPRPVRKPATPTVKGAKS